MSNAKMTLNDESEVTWKPKSVLLKVSKKYLTLETKESK
jgi:hypothetical protein